MRRFTITTDDWEKEDNPRRFVCTIRDNHATDNVASVNVWQREYETLNGYVLKDAVVGVTLTQRGIRLESSAKFDGEVRIAY